MHSYRTKCSWQYQRLWVNERSSVLINIFKHWKYFTFRKELIWICLFQGVESERCASFSEAMKAGKPVRTEVSSTIADGEAISSIFERVRQHSFLYLQSCFQCMKYMYIPVLINVFGFFFRFGCANSRSECICDSKGSDW